MKLIILIVKGERDKKSMWASCVGGDGKNNSLPRCPRPSPQIYEYVMLHGKITLHDFICSVADEITVAYQLITKMVRLSWTIRGDTI